jgi:hypothetical protein
LKRERIYIAGPMSGLPEYNYPAFKEAAERFRIWGWEPVETTDDFDGRTDLDYSVYIRNAIERVMTCRAIALLPGWEGSRGATAEVALALCLGMPVYHAVQGCGYLSNNIEGLKEESRRVAGEYTTRDSGEREVMETGSQRDTREGKGRFDLIPPFALQRLAGLYERGAAKYGDRNWELGQSSTRFYDSCMRHLVNYMAGDREEDHLAAVMWNAVGMMFNEERRRDLNDIDELAGLCDEPVVWTLTEEEMASWCKSPPNPITNEAYAGYVLHDQPLPQVQYQDVNFEPWAPTFDVKVNGAEESIRIRWTPGEVPSIDLTGFWGYDGSPDISFGDLGDAA